MAIQIRFTLVKALFNQERIVMRENIEQMWCGGCGGKDYLVFFDMKTREIMTECKKCQSVSRIKFTVTTSLVEDSDNQEGLMVSDHYHKSN